MAIFAFGCSGGETAKTDGGDTAKPGESTDAPKEGATTDASSFIGTYKFDASKEAADLDAQIADAKAKADAGDEAAKAALSKLELDKQLMEQMLADTSLQINEDKSFLMEMGSSGSVSGTYSAEGNKITLTPKEFTGDMKIAAPAEGEEAEAIVFTYDPADQSLMGEGDNANQPKLKKVS